MTVNTEYGNLDDVLKVINGRSVVPEGARAIVVYGHYRLGVIGELRKDTA